MKKKRKKNKNGPEINQDRAGQQKNSTLTELGYYANYFPFSSQKTMINLLNYDFLVAGAHFDFFITLFALN